jgi:N-acetylmuramoyl-L-alanine amidase
MIDEERIALSSPTRMVKSAAVVPLDFKPKVIDRLYAEAAKKKGFALAKARRIMIDAGHGGKDPGAVGYSGLQEKGVVLDICRQLKKILQERGFDVELTREDDRFLSLSERTLMASQYNADLFVSVHANASTANNAYGLEVYASQDLGFLDRIEPQRKVNETCLFGRLAMKRNDPDVERILSDMLYENKLSESDRLAEDISERTADFVRTKNRGAKTERFFVLRNTLVPAILVEVGFLSNPKEEKLLRTESYRRQIAQSLAEGIEDYADGTR